MTCLVELSVVSPAHAAAGDLDLSFGGDGMVTTPVGAGFDGGNAVALQPTDNKIVMAGYSHNGTNKDFALVRHNPDGTLDTTFSGDGRVTTPIGSDEEEALGMAIQSDGKIVVAGYVFNGKDDDWGIARYNANGSLDTTFDGDGKKLLPIGASDEGATSVAIQSDGKIVVAGYTFDGSTENFAVVRMNPNGTLDSTFDSDGKVVTQVGSSDEQIYALTIQSDGKIVAAGDSYSGAYDDFALVRYNPSGSLDSTFSGDGKAVVAISSGLDGAYAVKQQTDGKLAVTGYAEVGGKFDFALARFNANGTLDTSFDGDGKVTTAIGSDHDEASGLAVQQDGKLVVAGYSIVAGSRDFAVARYNSDGTPDTTFSGDGKLSHPIGAGADIAWGIALQSDGKILAAGQSSGGWNDDFAVVRYEGGSGPAPALPTLGINNVSVAEGDSGSVNATFTVSLSAASTATVGLTYGTVDNNAKAPADYTATSGTLSFAPGELTKNVTVPVAGDLLDEANETFYMDLSAPTNSTIADSRGVATITDNDATPTLAVDDVAVTETDSGTTNSTFTVSLSATSGRSVSVTYATADNSALAGSDYTTTSGTLSIPAGTLSKNVIVPILGDTISESTEAFHLNLTTPTNSTLADNQGIGTINDNDASEPPPSGTHDVGVKRNGLRSNKQVDLSREGSAHAVFLTVQNLGTVGEDISYRLMATGASVLSGACDGTIEGVPPGSSVKVRGCVVTYAGAGPRTLTLQVTHDDGDGGVDGNPANNTTPLKVMVKG